MSFILLVSFVAVGMWLWSHRPGRTFLADFAKLLDSPEFVDDFRNRLIGRSFLKGQFHGRKVVIMLQSGNEDRQAMVVVSMETNARRTMETYDFTGYRADREGELALYALEVKHKVKLRHEEGCLKAQSEPSFGFFFPRLFDPASVLEAMHTLAGSIERQTH